LILEQVRDSGRIRAAPGFARAISGTCPQDARESARVLKKMRDSGRIAIR